jgi:hypothetical protein
VRDSHLCSQSLWPQYNDFIYKLHYLVLFKLVDTANYLGIKPLVDLCLARIAFTLKSKWSSWIRPFSYSMLSTRVSGIHLSMRELTIWPSLRSLALRRAHRSVQEALPLHERPDR